MTEAAKPVDDFRPADHVADVQLNFSGPEALRLHAGGAAFFLAIGILTVDGAPASRLSRRRKDDGHANEMTPEDEPSAGNGQSGRIAFQALLHGPYFKHNPRLRAAGARLP